MTRRAAMRIKKLQLSENSSNQSLAVLWKDRWVVLSRLLAQGSRDSSEEFRLLETSSGDMIAFLQNRPSFEGKLNSLLNEADLDRCCQTKDMKEVIPFRPLLYRDFMLCERHVINSTRGFIGKIRPKMLPVIKLY